MQWFFFYRAYSAFNSRENDNNNIRIALNGEFIDSDDISNSNLTVETVSDLGSSSSYKQLNDVSGSDSSGDNSSPTSIKEIFKRKWSSRKKKDNNGNLQPIAGEQYLSIQNNQIEPNKSNNETPKTLLRCCMIQNDINRAIKRDNKLRKIGLCSDIFQDLVKKERPSSTTMRFQQFKVMLSINSIIDNDQRLFIKHKKIMVEIITKFEEIYNSSRNLCKSMENIEFKIDVYDFKQAKSNNYLDIEDLIFLYKKTSKIIKKKNGLLNLPCFKSYALKNILVIEEIRNTVLKISRLIIESTQDNKLILPLILSLLNS